MTAKTGAQRVAAHTARMHDKGFTKVWVWAHPEDRPAIRKYAEKKRKARGL